jgi:hypothetical protein
MGQMRQSLRPIEFAHTQNLLASDTPPWIALATFSILNVFAGIFLLAFLFRASSLITGFAACVILLGTSYVGWFVAGLGLCKKNLIAVSILAGASGASAALCILMRVLLSSRFATGFSSFSYQVARDPFELARLWVSATHWLTFLFFFYAATSAFLFCRFRRVLVMPGFSVLAGALLPSRRMLNVVLWWVGLNSFGVVLSFFLAFGGRLGGTVYGNALFLGILVLLGALQAFASCGIISIVKIRNKILLMVLGVAIGLVTAFGAVILGMFVLWVYAALGFWSFGLTGIFFGAMAGHSRWRCLANS